MHYCVSHIPTRQVTLHSLIITVAILIGVQRPTFHLSMRNAVFYQTWPKQKNDIVCDNIIIMLNVMIVFIYFPTAVDGDPINWTMRSGELCYFGCQTHLKAQS